MYPEDLKYHEKHMWARVEGDTVTVGITDYAQEQMGDIIYVDLPQGGEAEAGETFGSVESAKAIEDLVSPVSGQITAVNEELTDAPEKINADAHGDAWLIKVKITDEGQLENLLTAAQYQEFLGTLD